MDGDKNVYASFIDESKDNVLLETSMGDIVIQLRDDKPITTANFKKLVEDGRYDGTIFHRVVVGFMIQGGQINMSWPTIPDEIGDNNHNDRGTIAMAKTIEPNSATSQFFINLEDNSQKTSSFDATYSVFGDVVAGMNVVEAIAHVDVEYNSEMGETSKPVTDVVIIRATLL